MRSSSSSSSSSPHQGRRQKRLFDLFSATTTSSTLNSHTMITSSFASTSSQQSQQSQHSQTTTDSNHHIESCSPFKRVRKQIFLSPHKNFLSSHSSSVQMKSKIFIDTVHKHITLDPLCIRIIDTVEFQRLHSLKQLGTCDFVFRNATHTRFEHSLGVSHLAGRLVNVLRMNQPYLNLTDADVLCVKVAGLCHDLGHGPFSHVFDGVFLKKMYPSEGDGHNGGWRHEDGSVQMLRYILKENGISVSDYGLDDRDLLFIEEIISGTKEEDRKGRESKKFFLYDIVNNSRSGLDVDKLDYFQRDAKMACVAGNPPDFDRFIELARVLPSEPIHYHLDKYPLTICYPEKMIREAVALFATRFHMHQQVYTHQAVKQVEFMITDALELANPFIFIEGNKSERFPDGLYRISEVIYDMKALSNLNDSVLELILASREEGLQPAKDLLLRIKRRQLYKCVGRTAYDRDDACHQLSEEEILQEILSQHQQIIHESNGTSCGMAPFSTNLLESFEEEQESELLSENYTVISPDDGIPISAQFYQNSASPSKQHGFHNDFTDLSERDLIVEKMHIHYGMKSQNPVANLRFFQKNAIFPEDGNAHGALAKQVDERVYETLLPRSFEDRSVRLFCRTIEKEQAAIHAFERWCTSRNAHLPFPSLSQQE